jgi:hypothetical protein
MTRARFGALALASMILIGAQGAFAQTSGTEVALAETLYRQARDLMSQGKYDEACPKLAESYRLDRATGTLLNLASCHERQGKVTTAWSEFADAVVAARRDGRPDRVKFAEDRIKVLEPQLPKLTLVVPADADSPELEVRLDGSLIGAAARGVPTPVDPGKHAVEARAPKKLPWSRDLEIKAAEQQTVTIPKLVDAPAPPVAPNDVVSVPPVVPPRVEVAPRDDTVVARPVPASVYVVGSATLAVGVAAAITGVVFLEQRSQYKSGEGNRSEDSILKLGYVNAGLFAATGVGAALTAYLYFARPERKASDHVGARITPLVGTQGAGLSIVGTF